MLADVRGQLARNCLTDRSASCRSRAAACASTAVRWLRSAINNAPSAHMCKAKKGRNQGLLQGMDTGVRPWQMLVMKRSRPGRHHRLLATLQVNMQTGCATLQANIQTGCA